MPRPLPLIARAACAGALTAGLLAASPAPQSSASAASGERVTTQQTARATTARRVSRAVSIAAAQKGDPYRYGAAGPGAFDCSGLTYYSFRRAGFTGIPRTSSAQARFTKRISRGAMRRGDLMFFTGGGGVYHVGVFAGFKNGHRLILHSPSTGSRVRTDRVWTSRWFAGTLRNR